MVTVDHPDSYTGMIKYNVGGKGLTHGLRDQVQKLVDALRPPSDDHSGLNAIQVKLVNGNTLAAREKRRVVQTTGMKNEWSDDEEVQKVLEPMAELHHITSIQIQGAVTSDFAQHLQYIMSR